MTAICLWAASLFGTLIAAEVTTGHARDVLVNIVLPIACVIPLVVFAGCTMYAWISDMYMRMKRKQAPVALEADV